MCDELGQNEIVRVCKNSSLVTGKSVDKFSRTFWKGTMPWTKRVCKIWGVIWMMSFGRNICYNVPNVSALCDFLICGALEKHLLTYLLTKSK